jgi:hypothetical protein
MIPRQTMEHAIPLILQQQGIITEAQYQTESQKLLNQIME